MEFLEENLGIQVTAYSYYAAITMFVFGIVELAILKLLFSRKGLFSNQEEHGSVTVERSGGTTSSVSGMLWIIMIVANLLILPVIAFLFLGDVLKDVFAEAVLHPENQMIG